MPDPPTLVIFDCDGVLVDSEPISNAVLAAALSSAGLPTSPAESYDRYRGMLLSDVTEAVQRRLGSSLPASFWETYEQDRERAFEVDLKAVPGAERAVRDVKAAGLKVCVASQGKLSKTKLTLGLTGLRDLFDDDALFSAYNVARGKPHPDLFLHAARSMGSDPAECVVVEDTVIGIRAAVAAGMRVIAYIGAEDPGPARDAGAIPLRSLAELRVTLTAGDPSGSPAL